jgi:hypothetical protein
MRIKAAQVAPNAGTPAHGAWIEIIIMFVEWRIAQVAAYNAAWIALAGDGIGGILACGSTACLRRACVAQQISALAGIPAYQNKWR